MPIVPLLLSRPDFRFELRPHGEHSAKALHAAAAESKEHVSPWMAWLHTGYSPRDAEAWNASARKAWLQGSEYHFLIYDRTDEKLVGACGLNEINRKDLVCNLGYWVRFSKLRLGAATQAVMLLKDWAFLGPKFNRLEIVVAEGNLASRTVAEKVGAVYEGRQRCRTRVGEKVFDSHMYALIRPGLLE